MNLYGRTVTNYNGFSLGSVPMRQAFAQSCNTTFADIFYEVVNEGRHAKLAHFRPHNLVVDAAHGFTPYCF